MLIAPRRSFLFLVLALAAASAACNRSQSASTSASPDVWASVDGREIHRDEVEKAYRRAAAPDQVIPDDQAMAGKLNLLDQLITQNILLAKASELKIDLPEAELDTAFNDQKKGMPDDVFNKELVTRNLTTTDIREVLRRDLIAQKVITREVTSKITVTDQDITNYFNANKAKFNLPEDAYRLVQIVVTAVKDQGLNNRTGDDATSDEAAVAKVQMLMERLKAGTPFSELAMDYSEEPASAAKGGDVGLVPMSQLNQAPPKLRDAVLKSQPGTVTVVSMEGGHTIVGVMAKLTKGQRDPSMPDVRNNITTTLKDQREQLWRAAYIETIRNKSNVVNYAAMRIAETVAKTPSPAAASSPAAMPAAAPAPAAPK